MVDKKKSSQKQGHGSQPPTPPIDPIDAARDTTPSGEERQPNQNRPNSDVSEGAIVDLTRALVRWTALLAIATFLLGVAAVFQWNELHKTDKTLRETLEASQRAWIAPRSVTIRPYAYDNKLTDAVVRFRNVGREPAINIRHIIEMLAHVDEKIQWPTYAMNAECDRARIGTGPVYTAYPSDIDSEARIQLVPAKGGSATFAEAFADVKIVFVYGCFVYDTFGAKRESQFCFYVLPMVGKPETEWQWQFCSKGNDAK